MVKKMVFYVVAMIAFLPLLLIVNEGDSILPNVIGISYLAIWVCIFNSPIGEALYNFYNNLFNNGRND